MGAAILLSPNLTASDALEADLASATVTVAGGFVGDGDALAAHTAGTAITARYNAATKVLTLNGTYTLPGGAQKRYAGLDCGRPDHAGANPSRTLTTSNVTIYPGATQSVTSGGTASGTMVVSGSNQLLVKGGVYNPIFVRPSARQPEFLMG